MSTKWNEKNRIAKRKKIQRRRKGLLGNKACVRCGFNDPRALEFHHRDPKEKKSSIIKMILAQMEKLMEEVAKCDILCANCHAIEHSSRDWKE